MENEEVLIARARDGDREALNELVTRHWHPVYRFVSYKTGNLDEAQELTQETFFRAFRSLPDYRQTGATFKTYLCHIALNLIRDFWRKQGRSPALVELSDTVPASNEDDQPDIAAIRTEQRETLHKALQQLPEEQRQAVELRIVAGLPVREAALAMGKTEAAVKMLQQRALKNLRTLLLEQGINPHNQDGR